MKLCVCMKEVPEASAPKRIDPQTFRLDRSVPGTLNEFDTHALEEALRANEQGDGEVVAVLMGPSKAADSVRKALAIGADRAVHVVDDELADGKAKVKRQTEYGYDVIEAPLPCVVAVSDAINEPRYPSLKGIMGAKKKPQDAVGLSELGLEPGDVGDQGSRTEVYAVGDPPARGESRR